MLVTHLYVSHTPPCQSHTSILFTHLHVRHTPPCQSHSSMLVTFHHISHIPQCQSHSSMLFTFLHVWHTPNCQSHSFIILVTKSRHQDDGRGSAQKFQYFIFSNPSYLAWLLFLQYSFSRNLSNSGKPCFLLFKPFQLYLLGAN